MHDRVMNLSDCSEFGLTLQSRPSRILRVILLLLTTLLGIALAWSILTKADLVVRTSGRVRPVDAPKKVSTMAGSALGGRVVEVNYRPGDEVRAGAVLVKLDTERIENEIAKKRREIQAGEEELTKLAHLDKLHTKQQEASLARAKAELAHAESEVKEARARQSSEILQAQAEVEAATDELMRTRRLVAARAATNESLVKGQSALTVAKSKLARARVAIDDGKAKVAKEAIVVLERDSAVKREELAARQALKRSEIDSARLELANLELERRESELRAPMNGVVTSGELRPGDVIESGKPAFEVAEQKGFRFEALVPSEEMANVRVGMTARVRLDAYDYQRYGTLTGTVVYVAPDSTVSEGQRSALYVVRIELDGEVVVRGEYLGDVKLGMAGQVEIVTDRQSVLAILLKKIRQTISLG